MSSSGTVPIREFVRCVSLADSAWWARLAEAPSPGKSGPKVSTNQDASSPSVPPPSVLGRTGWQILDGRNEVHPLHIRSIDTNQAKDHEPWSNHPRKKRRGRTGEFKPSCKRRRRKKEATNGRRNTLERHASTQQGIIRINRGGNAIFGGDNDRRQSARWTFAPSRFRSVANVRCRKLNGAPRSPTMATKHARKLLSFRFRGLVEIALSHDTDIPNSQRFLLPCPYLERVPYGCVCMLR